MVIATTISGQPVRPFNRRRSRGDASRDATEKAKTMVMEVLLGVSANIAVGKATYQGQ